MSKFARIVSCLLSIIVSLLTVQLLTRHRQAEITDAHLLEEMEKGLPDLYRVHGPIWQARRNGTPAYAGVFEPLRFLPGFLLWALGLSAFGIAALITLMVCIIKPDIIM